MPHNHQKKAAVINDFSSFGRCSIAVALPILSAMKIQCCPVPTSMFTNHTGFDSYYWTDCTAHMPHYAQEWEKLGLKFDAIATGFLGSVDQIRIVRDFLSRFKGENTIVVVDPVMGDYGQLYPTYSLELAQAMGELVEYADIMTPNLTELCVLTNTPYRDSFSRDELYEMCSRLSSAGPEKVPWATLYSSGGRPPECSPERRLVPTDPVPVTSLPPSSPVVLFGVWNCWRVWRKLPTTSPRPSAGLWNLIFLPPTVSVLKNILPIWLERRTYESKTK